MLQYLDRHHRLGGVQGGLIELYLPFNHSNRAQPMYAHLLISVISDDKPGIVEAIAETVTEHGGNWLESRLSQLAGKFAGIVRVSIAPEQQQALEQALSTLSEKAIWVKCENTTPTESRGDAPKSPQSIAHVHVVGPDRTGIVREFSRALAKNNINLAALETTLSSMPYSGDPLFEAKGELEIPQNFDFASLYDALDSIADALGVDISLSEPGSADNA